MQAYWLVVRVLLTPPAEAAASQKWKIIYLQVLSPNVYEYCWTLGCGRNWIVEDNKTTVFDNLQIVIPKI